RQRWVCAAYKTQTNKVSPATYDALQKDGSFNTGISSGLRVDRLDLSDQVCGDHVASHTNSLRWARGNWGFSLSRRRNLNLLHNVADRHENVLSGRLARCNLDRPAER